MHTNEIILGGLAATGYVCPQLQPLPLPVPGVKFVIHQHRFCWREYVKCFWLVKATSSSIFIDVEGNVSGHSPRHLSSQQKELPKYHLTFCLFSFQSHVSVHREYALFSPFMEISHLACKHTLCQLTKKHPGTQWSKKRHCSKKKENSYLRNSSKFSD